jgi:hypothetical protein
MYTFTLIMFVLPISLLTAAWFSWVRAASPAQNGPRKYPLWRKRCEIAALILAIAATVFNLISWFSWFHNGGSPHGMTPPLGLWRPAGLAALCALISALTLAGFATGKRRWLLMGWGAAVIVVEIMMSVAEAD